MMPVKIGNLFLHVKEMAHGSHVIWLENDNEEVVTFRWIDHKPDAKELSEIAEDMDREVSVSKNPPERHHITKEQWNRLPGDYKTKIRGQPHVLMFDKETGSTVLVPVIIGKTETRKNPPYKGLDVHFSDEDHGVFLWKEDGVYYQSDSVGNYKTEKRAQMFADKLNEQHPELGRYGYVVRQLKYTRKP